MYELLVFDYVIYGSTSYRLRMLPNVDLRWNRFTHRKWKWIGCLVKKGLHAFAYDHQKIPNFKNIILTFLIFWKNWMKNVNFYFPHLMIYFIGVILFVEIVSSSKIVTRNRLKDIFPINFWPRHEIQICLLINHIRILRLSDNVFDTLIIFN